MSMDVGGSKGGLKADINVTPLVDVMLVLLIIMMLIAPMLQQGVSVRLPQASNTADKPETQDQTVVAVTSDKRLYLNGVPIRRANCRARSRRSWRRRRRKIVLIKGDEEAPYSAIMNAMDRLRGANIENIGLITERKIGRAGIGRPVMAHAHKHFGAEENVKSQGAPRERGHERHAAHRRAARAAHHLHGGAAAHAEGARHQPAAGDEGRDSSRSIRAARSCWNTPPTGASR